MSHDCMPHEYTTLLHANSVLQLIMAVWPVKDGEAMTVSVYDPKDVKTLELTVLSGWWTELGLPPLNAMSAEDLDGLAGDVA